MTVPKSSSPQSGTFTQYKALMTVYQFCCKDLIADTSFGQPSLSYIAVLGSPSASVGATLVYFCSHYSFNFHFLSYFIDERLALDWDSHTFPVICFHSQTNFSFQKFTLLVQWAQHVFVDLPALGFRSWSYHASLSPPHQVCGPNNNNDDNDNMITTKIIIEMTMIMTLTITITIIIAIEQQIQ